MNKKEEKMVIVNEQGYFMHIPRTKAKGGLKPVKRNWWLVVYSSQGNPIVTLGRNGNVYLPLKYIGKRIRFKVEIMED